MGCPACTGVLPFCDCDLDAEILDVAKSDVARTAEIATLRADLAASQREVERLRKIVIGFVADLFLNHESETVSMYDHDTEEEHDAIRYLAEIGRVEIVSEQGRRVVARWKP